MAQCLKLPPFNLPLLQPEPRFYCVKYGCSHIVAGYYFKGVLFDCMFGIHISQLMVLEVESKVCQRVDDVVYTGVKLSV